jgi:hypothetical protein
VSSLSLRSSLPDLRWIDVYASHDPVPNGPLAPRGSEVAGLSSKPVVNVRSWMRDHTAYWLNRCEFIPYVIRTIDEVAQVRLFTPSDVQALDQAVVGHHRNVRWLITTRWATRLSVLLLFVLFWNELLKYGLAVRPWLEAVDSRAGTVLEGLKTVAVYALPFFPRESVIDMGLRILGAAVPLLLIAAWRHGYQFVWRWWDGRAIEHVFRPGYLSAAGDRAVVDFCVLVAGFAPLLAVLAAPHMEDVAIGSVVAGIFLAFYSLLAVLVIGRFALKSPGLLAAAWRDAPGARAALKQELFGIGMVSLTVGFIFTMAMPGLRSVRDAVLGLLVVLIAASFTIHLQVRFVNRVQVITRRTVMRYAAFVAPISVTLALTVVSLKTRPRPIDLGGVSDVAMQTFGLHLFVLALGYGIAWLTTPSARKSRPY